MISTSYGNCEANYQEMFTATLQADVKQANSQGQTVTAASVMPGGRLRNCVGNNRHSRAGGGRARQRS